MANRGLGSLTLDLIAKIGGFTGPLSKAERELDTRTKRMNKMANDFGRSIGSSLRSAFTGFLAFAGVSVSIGAVTASLKDAIDRADELRDASIRLGVGVDVLSKWSYAAKQTGTDIDGLTRGLKLLSKNATEALDPKSTQAGLFSALGVSKDALTDLTKLVPQVADAFQKLPDGPQKAAVALELFGKSGVDLVEFLNQGSKGLDDFGDKAAQLGIVISQDTANAADEFNDKLDDLKTAFTGISTQVASELLPQLTKIVDWAVEFVSDGDHAAEIADDLSKALNGVAAAGDAISHLIGIIGQLRDILAEADKASAWLANLGGLAPGRSTFIADMLPSWMTKDLLGGGSAPANANRSKFSSTIFAPGGALAPQYSKSGGFSLVNQVPYSPGGTGNTALDKYFATGGRTPNAGGGKGGGGKSQEQKDAEQLAAAYQRMTESLKEQIALFGKTGETAKERYELELGELAKLDPARKAELTAQLDKIDQMHAEKDLQEQLTKIETERQDQIDRAVKNADEQIADMQFELSLLSLTNKEREREIALRYAGADATDAQKAAIARLSDQMVDGQQKAQFFSEVQHDLSDAFYDAATGAGKALDIVKDFFDNLAQYITRMISDNWAEKLGSIFSQKSGASGSSSSGGFWSSLFGAFFGSGSIGVTPGAASGGWRPGNSIFEVNERGFEMASVGGRDYMLTGANPVNITPNHALAGAGVSQINNFNYAAPYDPRTAQQTALRVGYETRRAQARNGR